MKRVTRHILITLLALVLAAAIIALVYFFPLFSMHPSETGTVTGTNIIALHTGKNSLYFIPAEGGYLAVDAGTSATRVQQGMDAAGISASEVTAVLLTHTDSDHTGALTLFANADIYINEDELQMVNGATKRNLFGRNTLPEEVMRRLVPVGEMETLVLNGQEIVCIKAPGHTPGSMAFKVSGQHLFVGDALRIQNNTASTHPFTMNSASAAQSIQKLLETAQAEGLTLFTAHYGVFNSADIAA